jgi:hypothetical protein
VPDERLRGHPPTPRLAGAAIYDPLRHRLIDGLGSVKPLGALIFSQGLAGQRAEQAVHFSMIIALLLQGGLHIGNDLIKRRGTLAHINVATANGSILITRRNSSGSGLSMFW